MASDISGIGAIESAHFIGIGGVGMSGIALIASQHGMKVTGSDLKDTRATRTLAASGVEVSIGQRASNIPVPSPDVVVISSAVHETNLELKKARELGIPVMLRAQMLAYLGRGKKTLAVAGTHGKTTTSSMLATTLDRLGKQPTFLIGGTVIGYDTNALAGTGEYYVVEADESDGSFTNLSPYIALITNIEEDHLDHYAGIDEIEAAFSEFMGSVPDDGAIVICGEHPHLVELAKATGRRTISYGFADGCDVRCSIEGKKGLESDFLVVLPDGRTLQASIGKNPGRHNVLNATGVLAALWFLGEDMDEAARQISLFAGVHRRFDHVDNVCGIEIVDDYGHHPTEVAATIEAAKGLGYKHVHVLFQPHRYTRTEALAKQWGSAFDDADSVTFMDVYSAGEAPIPGVTGKLLVDSVLAHNPRAEVAWMPHRADIAPFLVQCRLRSGDLLLTMGAGDVTEMGPVVAGLLHKEEMAQ